MKKGMPIALFVAMLIAIQPAPAFAQEDAEGFEDAREVVTILDLEYATDEELAYALGTATELELIMRTDWGYHYTEGEPVSEAERPADVDEEPAHITEEPDLETETIAEEAPRHLSFNAYLQESVRLVRLAEEAFERGDYEAAANYALEANRYAQLSEGYIAQ